LTSRAIRLICRLEGGQMWSATYRELLSRIYRVEVGLHSYGTSLYPGHLPPGTRIGNYCSIADGLVALRRNHTIDRVSQHPFFYNAELGLVDRGLIAEHSDNPLVIGHDVWIGLNVLITPACRRIGDGAVVAAGSVVTGDVKPFSIVGGVPARQIRWRFDEATRDAIANTQWWLKPVWELGDKFDKFATSVNPDVASSLAEASVTQPGEAAPR
jgi:virginiamycin A acetyltransferase